MAGFLGSSEGFSGGSDGKNKQKKSLGLIPGLGRSPGSMTTHSSILAWRISMDKGAWQATVHGAQRVGMTEQLSTQQRYLLSNINVCFHIGQLVKQVGPYR